MDDQGGMRNATPTEKTRSHGIRTALAATAAVTAICLLGAAPASASLKIVAPATAKAQQPVHFSASPSAPTQTMAFYVDGRRRWVDTSPSWQFGPSGYVDLNAGRHVLKVRARQTDAVVTTTRTIYVEPSTSGGDAHSPVASASTSSHPASSRAPAAGPGLERSVPVSAPNPEAVASGGSALREANCENGLSGWSTAGVGEAVPTVTSSSSRTGAKACRVVLSGTQNRSELIFGGSGQEAVEFHEGDEYWYGFSFNIQQMVYGHPGDQNIIMQFKSDGEGSPAFGLQLWDYAGDDGHSGGKGLWSEGTAMGEQRYLAPVSERQWHDVAIHFKASAHGNGFYEVFLDGNLVDARSGVSMIVPGHSYAYIKDGLYRNGAASPGTSELLLDSAKLGTSATAVQPG